MKHFLLSAAALITFSGLATAGQIQCTPVNSDVIHNAQMVASNVACATVTADAGFHLTSWSLTLNASWQDSLSPTTLHQLQFFSNPSASASGNTTCSTSSAGFTGSCQGVGPTVGIFATTFQTNVNTFAQTVGGLPLPNSASITVFLNYDETKDPSGVPEPMTMSLMGAGLVAIGLVGRR